MIDLACQFIFAENFVKLVGQDNHLNYSHICCIHCMLTRPCVKLKSNFEKKCRKYDKKFVKPKFVSANMKGMLNSTLNITLCANEICDQIVVSKYLVALFKVNLTY